MQRGGQRPDVPDLDICGSGAIARFCHVRRLGIFLYPVVDDRKPKSPLRFPRPGTMIPAFLGARCGAGLLELGACRVTRRRDVSQAVVPSGIRSLVRSGAIPFASVSAPLRSVHTLFVTDLEQPQTHGSNAQGRFSGRGPFAQGGCLVSGSCAAVAFRFEDCSLCAEGVRCVCAVWRAKQRILATPTLNSLPSSASGALARHSMPWYN